MFLLLLLLATFLIQNVKWNSDGNSLVLIGKDQFCITYLKMPEINRANNKVENDIDDQKLEITQ